VEKNITLDGLRLYYNEEGEGYPVILLHGWGGTRYSFDELREVWGEKYHLYVLDLPGFGDSSEPLEAWGVSKYSNFVLDFLEINNIKQCIFLGHSFGGRISIKIAANHPQKVKSIILCASAGIKPKKKLKHKVLYGLAKTGKKVFSLPILRSGQTLARKILYKTARTSDYLKVSGVMKESFKKVIDEDLTPFLSKIKVPTLLIWGENDTVTPVQDAQIMHSLISNSELIIIPNVRHAVHKQDSLGKIIDRFLDKQK